MKACGPDPDPTGTALVASSFSPGIPEYSEALDNSTGKGPGQRGVFALTRYRKYSILFCFFQQRLLWDQSTARGR